MLNIINNYPNLPSEAKYKLLRNKRKNTGLKYFNGSTAFIEYSNDKVYNNIEENNPNKKQIEMIVFNDTIAVILNNIKLNLIVTEFF